MSIAQIKAQLKRLRPLLVVGWVSYVCIWYLYYYAIHLYQSYPILHQVREVGILEMVRRYVTP